MHSETHDPRGEHIVAHVGIPRRPQLLEVVEGDIVPRYLIELVPECVLGVREHYVGDGAVGRIVTVRRVLAARIYPDR